MNRQTYVKTFDGREQENLYDGEGLRAGLSESGKISTFIFHNGEIHAECDENGTPVKRHLQGQGLFCVQTLNDSAYHMYHQDEQGSTVYITGNNGAVENSYAYDAFGNVLVGKESIENRIQYTGQQYDQETGQYYLRARYYNPVIGRFTQEDTYRGDGLNLYAYCGNNPVMYYDPSGHDGMAYSDEPSAESGQSRVERVDTEVDNGVNVPDGIEFEGSRGTIELSNSNIQHIKKHTFEGMAEQANYLTDEQLANKLNNTSFFNKDWTQEEIVKYTQEAYNTLRSQGKTGLQSIEINGDIINIFIKDDGTFDTAYGVYKYDVTDFR